MTTGNPVEAIRRAYVGSTISWSAAYSQLISLGFDDDEAQQQLSRWTVEANAREPIAKPKVPKTPLLTVPAEYRTQYPRVQTPWEPGAFEQSYPDVAWRSAYGLPAYGRNPFQEWLNTQSGPAFASYWANQFRSPLETPVDFDPLAQQNRGTEALAALRGMRGVEEPEQQYWMSRLQATPGVGGGAGQTGLFDLMTAALGKQGGIGYASPIARAKAARMEPLYAKWEQTTRAGETGPTLLDYLLQEILGL